MRFFVGDLETPHARRPGACGAHAARTAQLFDDSAELHFCCICGALLWADLEDEIDGEGTGRDICGDCNRTKNYEAMMGNE